MRVVKVEIQVGKSLLIDIVNVAMEGGVGYWAEEEEYDSEAGTAVVTREDGEERTRHEITPAVVLLGLQRAAAPKSPLVGESWQLIVEALATGDASNIDAELADTIVQLGLFNELVYG